MAVWSRIGWAITLVLGLLGSIGAIGPAAPVFAATLPVVDDFEDGLPIGVDPNGVQIGFFTAQDPASTVAFATSTTPPAAVPGAAAGNTVLRMDFTTSAFGVLIHGFENAAVNQWISQDWSAYEGLSLWVYGNNSNTELFIDVIDNRNDPPLARDDAERYTVTFRDNFSGWQQLFFPFDSFSRKEIGNGAPNDGFTLTEVHGWAFGTLLTPGTQTYYVDDAALYGTAPERPLLANFASAITRVREGRTAQVFVRLSKPAEDPVTVQYAVSDGTAKAGRDYLPTAGSLTFAPGVTRLSFGVPTIDDSKWQGERTALVSITGVSGAALGTPAVAGLTIQNTDPYDPALIDDFENAPYLLKPAPQTTLASQTILPGDPRALPGQYDPEGVLVINRARNSQSAIAFDRFFAIGQDWRGNDGMNLWFYGQNSGRKVKVTLHDNRHADTGPNSWQLAWRDEFNSPAGTRPDPRYWGFEIGDGTVNSIPGWGNDELQYYTDRPENAATDGQGNMVLTVREADGSLTCYYGPCRYTSARLLTKNRFEFGYGKIEARIKVPGGAGLWPAFWSLGNDIDLVGWPQTGEIDIMEFVGRRPNEIFGTIHGPGYSGGQSYGNIYDFGTPVPDRYHTYTVEWQPNKITWYVDGIKYHEATPGDPFLQGKEWVFDHPFFLLLNVAVGGNFGGAVGPDATFPASMLVDYVRVYQPAETAERFETQFTDNFAGWKRVTLPFSSFGRSSEQPAGAPNDGLTLSNVAGYSISVPGNFPAPVLIDQVRLQANCTFDVAVSNTADSGSGSLRQALADVCFGGTISFAPTLAGQTIILTSTELTIARPVTIDGIAAPGLTISGGNSQRLFVVNPSSAATIRNLRLADGYGFELAGGILNNGLLTLDRVSVENNRVDTSGEDFWKGGAGIYNGDGSTLTLIDSTVRNNTANASNGGGIYAFFNSFVSIERSTISGNTANVGGGLRSLGDVEILNSTLSGNSSYGWHGGAIFHTNGALAITSATITNNAGPDWAPSTIFIGSFDASIPRLTLTGTIIAGNRWYACDRFTGTVEVVSGGNNIVQDDTCRPVASDIISGDAGLAPLADNGGPTQTHALLPGSPAIDAAPAATAPATDQRGVSRPQGGAPDIGAYEAVP
ncbi:MAG TPA: family 16 glycosylhydrolase [Roseiflexaceae bacterium]|nr:family 16 glycosylhydrolase [Roseiflexaceae bacterium]